MAVEVSQIYVPRPGSFMVNVKLGTDGPPRRTPQSDIERLFMGVNGVQSAKPALQGHAVWEIEVNTDFDDHLRDMLGYIAQAIVNKENA